jgi:hypothetical protein
MPYAPRWIEAMMKMGVLHGNHFHHGIFFHEKCRIDRSPLLQALLRTGLVACTGPAGGVRAAAMNASSPIAHGGGIPT